jgi:hypothetical protein
MIGSKRFLELFQHLAEASPGDGIHYLNCSRFRALVYDQLQVSVFFLLAPVANKTSVSVFLPCLEYNSPMLCTVSIVEEWFVTFHSYLLPKRVCLSNLSLPRWRQLTLRWIPEPFLYYIHEDCSRYEATSLTSWNEL